MKKLNFSTMLIFLSVMLTSCATVPVKPINIPASEVYPVAIQPAIRQDVCHAVAPGETLWRLSKMYDVPIKEIMMANSLKSRTYLKMGQRIYIPDAASLRPVIPLYRSNKWKFIIIHHSATDEGSALCFNLAHYSRGFRKGLGYHFVINNGTKGKSDGQIEVSPRWIKQEDGSHCKAGGMNHKGIGICLVGNFCKEKATKKQVDSLISLVNILRKHFNIPMKNIIGHSHVAGAKTKCPGKYFPWRKFKNRLKNSS